ncbi:MAG: hypothetical protein DI536_30615 [Archangium gephyra]|uniref:Uncharacterized protein n=1 Tax=Archangium gephyra TaxID=48 RepID=A0A2W5SSP5_9BACT|nr:MAG: hypothetical protein DI536_30615 [Archangium gephyra]
MQRLWLAALFALAACKTVPLTPASTLAALRALPGAYLSGPVVTLNEPAVLNREDFVYDAKLSPDGSRAAISRLAGDGFHVAVFNLTAEHSADTQLNQTRPVDSSPDADPRINVSEFDVEGLEFSPDGSRIAAVSRDGTLRVLDARSGALLGSWTGEEPLVSVAWSTDGGRLALGGAAGLITLVDAAGLSWLTDVRPHGSEVRAVAFRADGSLVSVGWDGSLQVHALGEARNDEARLRFRRLEDLATVSGIAAHTRAVTVAFDARVPVTVLRGELARELALEDVPGTVTVMTASGPQLARKKKLSSLSLRQLSFDDLTVAVCDACLPAGVAVLLGESALSQLDWAIDSVTDDVVVRAKPGAPQVKARLVPTLVRRRHFRFAAPINDLSLDASGEIAGLAFSSTRAVRDVEVYTREKQGLIEPEREWDCAARVKVDTGEVLERVHGHRGVVSSAAISPDGKTLVSGGWDKKLIVHGARPLVDARFGWSLRRVRFSRDGTKIIAAAWTPLNPLGDHRSDPAAVVYEVVYDERATVTPASAAPSDASRPAERAE